MSSQSQRAARHHLRWLGLNVFSHPAAGLLLSILVVAAGLWLGHPRWGSAGGLIVTGIHLALCGARWERPLAVTASAILAMVVTVAVLPVTLSARMYVPIVAVFGFLGGWLASEVMPGGRWALAGVLALAVGHMLNVAWWQMGAVAAAVGVAVAILGPYTGILLGAILGGVLTTLGAGPLLLTTGPKPGLVAGAVVAGLGLGWQLKCKLGGDAQRLVARVGLTAGSLLVMVAVAEGVWAGGLLSSASEASRAVLAMVGAAARLFCAHKRGITTRARLGVITITGVFAGWQVLGESRLALLAVGTVVADMAIMALAVTSTASKHQVDSCSEAGAI